MKGIIALCVRRPVAVIMLIAAFFLGAVYSLKLLPLDRLPEIIYPHVTVEAAWPGMGAAEVRAALTVPLEDSLSPVKGLESLRSVSRDGESLLLLGFRWGTVPARAAALVREAIDAAYPALPHGVSKPAVISGDPSGDPHAIVAVRSLAGDAGFARNLAEYELRSRFRRIDGAGTVIVSGGETREIRIRADDERLVSRSLTAGDLAEMIAYETGDFPAGSAREGNRELTVVSSGRPRSEEELASLVLQAHGAPLSIGEISVTAREASKRQSLFIFGNSEQTALEIFRRPGADPVRLSKEIKKAVMESSSLFSGDAEISLIFDSSPSIVRAVRDLLISGGLAALVVILLLTLFLGRVSCSILAALSLPFSASAALVVLAVTGRTLNSMSLGGLALGIGLVSDTSVIVLDLFCRNFALPGNDSPADKAGALAASVSLSSLSGTLTTVAVFLPVIFLPGPLGELFGDLSLSLIVSVAAGWFYAQFCLPSLFCFFAARGFVLPVLENTKTPKPWITKFVDERNGRLEKIYGAFLRKLLRRPFPLIAVSVLASLLGLLLLCERPAEFIAPDAVSEIEAALDFPSGTLIDAALPYGLRVSAALSAVPGIASLYGRMGAEADDACRRASGDYRKERLVFRCFLERGANAREVLERTREVLLDFESGSDSGGKVVTAAGFPADRTAALLGLSPALTLAVKGGSQDECVERAENIAARFRREAASALRSIRLWPSGTRPELRLLPRREASASLGISASGIASSVYAATEGIVTGSLEIEGRPIDVRVSGGTIRENPERLGSLPLPVPARENDNDGGTVFLGSLVDIEWIEAPVALVRQDRSDVSFLDIFPAAGKEIQIQKLISKYSDANISRSDESVFEKYKSSLAATVILVLILLYLILCAQFESFSLPLVLMLAIPFSLAGAGPALLFSGSSLDSGSVLGLVALFGVAVNNGIVFYEISEEKIRSGLSPQAAVYSGARGRFRPVLLTTLTTIFALLPLVVSPLGNSQRGMASTMLGGMTVSALLAFFALPPVFILFLKSRRTLCQ